VDLLRGRIAFIAGPAAQAPKLLLDAAKRLERFDVSLARETYFEALRAAVYAGRFALGTDVRDVTAAAHQQAAPPAPRRACDQLLEGLVLLLCGEPSEATAALRNATNIFRDSEPSQADDPRWRGLACAAACANWDHDNWYRFASHDVQRTRETGALTMLPVALNNLAILVAWQGDLDGADVLVAEAEAINEVTGSAYSPYAATLVAAIRGREGDAAPLIEATRADAVTKGAGHAVRFTRWATATLYNGLGQYDLALDAAQAANAEAEDWSRDIFLHELIEAAVRAGRPAIASAALERLSRTAHAIGTDWPLGIEARCRALISGPVEGEILLREAIDRLERTPIRVELSRTHLLYGESLRRENRRVEARHHLRVAYESFVTMGVEGFAERARRELAATGETVRKRAVDTRAELTAQEAQVALLAAAGRTNPEIGAELYLSARTVEWHLGKVFSKLGITSRRELRKALRPTQPVDSLA
jgi:ATP/maltotriose-dependent transcriptional regulator MalT